MPPKVRITKIQIVEIAVLILRENGLDGMNARKIAEKLGCSTQPIFSNFSDMKDLTDAVREEVETIYTQWIQNGMQQEDSFLGLGLAYIDFAKKEKNLFKFLFMSNYYQVQSIYEMVDGEDNREIIEMLTKKIGLSEQNSRQLYIDIWLVTHGIASMFATNSCNFSEGEIRKIMSDAFYGFIHQLKLGDQ